MLPVKHTYIQNKTGKHISHKNKENIAKLFLP
jgi:hypothetical protein